MDDDGVVNTQDHAGEYVETLRKHVISKYESLHLVCAFNKKVYIFFTKGKQPINDMTPHNDEDFRLIGLDMEQVVIDKSGNTMLFAEEDGSFGDYETFDPISNLRAIRLIPIPYFILKLNICYLNA